ncbi:MAG: LCP family protein [Bacilli bacterium]|nr:LCP family protein [Bacilli bacterium]MDD4795584.1 LCP family protein [Bacilli bacterium]
MKNLIIKLKRTKKSYRCLFYSAFILYLVSFIFISKGLLLLSGIVTLIRISFIIIFFILFSVYTVSSLVFLILKKHKHVVITSVLVIIFSFINFFAFYYINKTYGYIDNISKDKVLYTTNLITLAGKEDIKNIGIISEENDIEGYILPTEYLNKNKNNYQITYYDDYLSLLNDLYDEEIDGAFITSNFVLIYSSVERFNNIKTDTRIHAVYSKEMKNPDLISSNKSVTEPFTILIMGVDSQYEGLSQNAAFNGDTLMLITFNPKTLSATIFSIPRDTYVPIACNNNRKYKINSAAGYGSKCMIDTIENLTDIDIDYYMKINFKGLVALVDALGGITVDVPVPDYPSAYCEQDSNRVAKKICLKPGVGVLNGEEALALARVRDAFIISDFKRVQNQQLIIEAIVQKAKTIRNINDFYKVLNAISNNLDTNLSTKEMLNFYNVGKNILAKSNLNDNDFINIQKTYLNGDDLYIYLNGYNTYTFQYYEESLNEIVKAMKVNLEIEKPELIKNFYFSVNKPYKLQVIGKDKTGTIKEELLPDFVSKNLDYLENWNSSKNISINKEYKESNTCINNEILSQSVHSGTPLSNVTTFKVTICKNIIVESPITDEPITEENPIDDLIENMLD